MRAILFLALAALAAPQQQRGKSLRRPPLDGLRPLPEPSDAHCLLDAVNRTVRNARDMLDWGGNDRAFSKWWGEHVSDFKLDEAFCPGRNYLDCLEPKWRDDGVTVLQSGGEGICRTARKLANAPKPYVFITPSENWGVISSQTFNRTATWNYWTDAQDCLPLREPGTPRVSHGEYVYNIKHPSRARTRLVRDWLEDPNLRLVLSTQHQSDVRHPKVVAIPLGIRRSNIPLLLTIIMGGARPARGRLLLINNSGWKFRAGINALVAANFKPPLENLYCSKRACYPVESAEGETYGGKALDERAYLALSKAPPDADAFFRFHPYGQILTSKFVLCPPGLGADSYRIWEVLYLGAIPVVERTGGGFDDVFVDLPVLLVDDFSEIDERTLAEAYARLSGHCGAFNYRKLAKAYWLNLVRKQGASKLGRGHEARDEKPRDASPFLHRGVPDYPEFLSAKVPEYLLESIPPAFRPPKQKPLI